MRLWRYTYWLRFEDMYPFHPLYAEGKVMAADEDKARRMVWERVPDAYQGYGKAMNKLALEQVGLKVYTGPP